MSDSPVPSEPTVVNGKHLTHTKLFPLALGALGIVYGDIGTSPLYAIAECFAHGADGQPLSHALAVSNKSVLGILSLFFWSLTLAVTVKYLLFVTRADNKGEGGIFALLALVPNRDKAKTITVVIVFAGLLGASLLYADGVITPAISILSAVEGIGQATHAADDLILPISMIILTGLFMVQRRGTGRIGKIFGPVMVVWFLTLATLGVRAIIAHPEVLTAINPYKAIWLFKSDPLRTFKVLGSVVLCVTGGEALYADLGHFGAKPIRLAWFAFVLPALLLNYFGQGATLLAGGWVEKPFWALVPQSLMYPMVGLATVAAIIASQALISGSFSLARQAVQLGFLPRVTIVHTSAKNEGQIYVPEVSNALMIACLALVLAFQSSSSLAAAYGTAVTGTMIITSILFTWIVTQRWKWRWAYALPLMLLFLSLDIPFFLANALKFFDGGWFPIVLAIVMFSLMTTWSRGRKELARRFNASILPLENLLRDLETHPPPRVRGTAVFMSSNPSGTPPVLLHHLKHNQLLHRQVVLLSIVQVDHPYANPQEQLEVKTYNQNFYRIIWQTGFMETPNVPAILKKAWDQHLVCEPSTTSYFLGRETLLTNGQSSMMRWRKGLFAFISRNALPATSYYSLPPGSVVELGMQVEL